MGKFGGIVSISTTDSPADDDQENSQVVSNIIAQHVVGLNPKSIGRKAEVEKELPSDMNNTQETDQNNQIEQHEDNVKSNESSEGSAEARERWVPRGG